MSERIGATDTARIRFRIGDNRADIGTGTRAGRKRFVIVDVHTHCPRYRTQPPEGSVVQNAKWRPDQVRPSVVTWEDQIEAMKPVDKAIIFNIASDPREGWPDNGGLHYPTPQVNDDIATFVRENGDKYIGFLTLHPHDPKVLDEIERATGDLGLRGIKLGPNYQNFDPIGEEAFRVYKRAEELGLPILFHQGTSPVQFATLDYAHPRHMDTIAMAFPNLKVIMAHMAHPWQVDCFVVIRKHPNVYADISANFYRPWSYYNAFRMATEWGVLPKLLFGSDYPVATPQETMDALQHVNDVIEGTKLPPVPQEELDNILHRDSLALLGLE
jgi:predicted TIM-barrel fold metal-dependent hydrolase